MCKRGRRGEREIERERMPFSSVFISLCVFERACGCARECVCHRRLTELMRELVIAFRAAQTAREPYEVIGRRARGEMRNNVVCINLAK